APLADIVGDKDDRPAIARCPAEADDRAGIDHLHGQAQGPVHALAADDAPGFAGDQLDRFDIVVVVVAVLVADAGHHAYPAVLDYRDAEQAIQRVGAGGQGAAVVGL